jgi:pimeloyl-ACP methyl ester carboxylesterase
MSELKTDQRPIEGVASGVPFLAIPPEGGANPESATIVAWHLLDPPRTPAAFAAALPLAGVDAWRVYLGLPMSGSRKPAGGDEELLRLGYEDGVLNIQGPITDQAAREFGAAFAEIAVQLNLGSGPVGLVGGSAGAAVALLVLAEQDIDVAAAVLVSPLVRLRSLVEAMERHFGVEYSWSDRSREVATRLDFVERAGEIAERRQDPAVLLVVGEDDDIDGLRRPAEELRDALAGRYAEPARVRLELVSGMGHQLAEPPGDDPAPQTPSAGQVDRLAVDWFRRYLRSD